METIEIVETNLAENDIRIQLKSVKKAIKL